MTELGDGAWQRGLDRLLELLARGPDVGQAARFGALTRAERRAVLRATRHVRLHDQEILRGLLDLVAPLGPELYGVTKRVFGEAASAHHPDPALVTELRRLEVKLAALEHRIWAADLERGVVTDGDPQASIAAWKRHLRPGSTWHPIDCPPVARVATDVGDILIAADDTWVLPTLRAQGCWEPEDGGALESVLRLGATVVIVGAHVGYQVLRAARVVGPAGRVVAVEPEPHNFAMLCANLAINGAENVVPIEAAALERTGTIALSVAPDRNTGDNRAFHKNGWPQTTVASVALDDLFYPDVSVDVVFVDAQATDHLAIRGMSRTIQRNRPTMLVEFWPIGLDEVGQSPEQVLAEYEALGYEISFTTDESDSRRIDRADTVIAARTSLNRYVTLLLTPRDG